MLTRCQKLEALRMNYQRHIAKIRWQDYVRNTDVSSTGLSTLLDPIVRRCSSFLGHVARLPDHTSVQCPPSIAVPHLPVTRSFPRSELEAMCRPPPLDQLRRDVQQHMHHLHLLTSGDEPSYV